MSQTKRIPGEVLKRLGRAAGDRLRADEVFAWRAYDDRVVVVTTDGRKHVVRVPAGAGARS